MSNEPLYVDDAEAREFAIGTLKAAWGVILLTGLITLGIGVALLVWPKATVGVVAFLFGIWLLIAGVLRLFAAFTPAISGGTRALFILGGAISLILGVFLVKNILSYDTYDQKKAAALFAIFIAVSFLLSGIGSLLGALASPGMPGRSWRIVSGVIAILAGIVVLAWPLDSLQVLVWVSGIMFVIVGLAEVIDAFVVRSEVKRLLA